MSGINFGTFAGYMGKTYFLVGLGDFITPSHFSSLEHPDYPYSNRIIHRPPHTHTHTNTSAQFVAFFH